ncbi:non-hydrolyzing UDP-N-acetylglucosamine 2-epimerase [Ructibacterium gallinarum]|uniref:UDP-N-acetylglucosamine 2-epimerase (non-hydrolyzing) n=1 Tax=Ructibacterium gallinarum TaxID=2779355 RepID=A0A9D5LYE0_9FIRM|nr:UDP-N-acetylglucosamine 2-epimerase (non-hydrolyzing) [Ructibacterium gallinarum]MBE5040278.1 UDP-N-acetylglucosamine 2-epimerase (non-hydrolyzing) [Ructibacterium gallinarum]
MSKIKVMTIFGTRPEAIKMAPLVKELERHSDKIDSIVCVTAQHRQMLDQVLEIFSILPDYDLNIMKERQTLVGIATRALEGLDQVMKEAQPDLVLVHGDTSTTFAGSLAAFYNQIAVGHVEAGLRTYDKYFPYPEEINRRITGVIADMHFAPTERNRQNLLQEHTDPSTIYVTGNTVIDALKTTVRNDYVFKDEGLRSMHWDTKRVIVMTAHRRENLGEPLRNICNAVRELVEEFEDIEVVYPVHLNPAVRETAYEILGGLDRVRLIEPVNADELHNAIQRGYLVLTDSGGLQEEAPSLGKPVLVLRNETERPEAVEAGTVKIAGVQKENIVKLARELLTDENAYRKMAKAVNPYGDGFASGRIVKAILEKFIK